MSKRPRRRRQGNLGSRTPRMSSTDAVVPARTSTSARAKQSRASHGARVKGGASEPLKPKRRPWWGATTTWAGRVVTSVVVTVLGTAAVYGVHSVLSRGREDLSAPPVKIEAIEVYALDNDLLSAKAIRSARVVKINTQGLIPAVGITGLIHAEGNRNGLVRIIDIHVLKSCGAPLRGTLVFLPSQGEINNLGIGFNLDDANPVAEEVPNSAALYGLKKLGPSYFALHEYDLTLGEPITLAISAETTSYFCKFSFELDLLVNGRPVTQIIEDGGKPFVVSAEYDLPGEGWLPDFRAYSTLYVPEFTVNACSSDSGLVAENPQTWQYPPPTALPKSGHCASAPRGAGGT
jgi:hypothetical protein